MAFTRMAVRWPRSESICQQENGRFGLLFVSICILLVVATPRAQGQEGESGVFAGAALGLGTDPSAGAEYGGLGYIASLQLGFRVKTVWIGLEHTGLYDHEDTRRRNFIRSFFVMLSPIPRGPHIKAGAGLATSNPFHPIRYTVVDRYGLGLVGGIGYDLALSRAMSITAGADFHYHQYGTDEPLPSSMQIALFTIGAKILVWKKR